MSELIDVVIPVYNSGKYLDKCLQSFKEQIFKNFKIIIVYDKSADNSWDILIKYKDIFGPDYFEILESPKKDGLGAARDYALSSGKINGKYVIFPDSDDYVEKEYLSSLYEMAIKSGADITYCGFTRFDDKSGKKIAIDMVHNEPEIVTSIKEYEPIIFLNMSAWNKLYKVNLFTNDVCFTNIKRAEDCFLFLKVIPSLKSIAFVNKSLYNYRIRAGSLSNDFSKNELQIMIDGFKGVEQFYKDKKIEDKSILNIYEAIGFLRIAVGATYRAISGDKKHKKEIMALSRSTVDEMFHNYRTNPLLSYRTLKKLGFKARLIWQVKRLYQHNHYGLFVFSYNLYTKLFKKDIKW